MEIKYSFRIKIEENIFRDYIYPFKDFFFNHIKNDKSLLKNIHIFTIIKVLQEAKNDISGFNIKKIKIFKGNYDFLCGLIKNEIENSYKENNFGNIYNLNFKLALKWDENYYYLKFFPNDYFIQPMKEFYEKFNDIQTFDVIPNKTPEIRKNIWFSLLDGEQDFTNFLFFTICDGEEFYKRILSRPQDLAYNFSMNPFHILTDQDKEFLKDLL